jgi:hypothetical protein
MKAGNCHKYDEYKACHSREALFPTTKRVCLKRRNVELFLLAASVSATYAGQISKFDMTNTNTGVVRMMKDLAGFKWRVKKLTLI